MSVPNAFAYTANESLLAPSLATVTLTYNNGGVGFTTGPWVEVEDSTPQAWALTGVSLAASVGASTSEIDVGTGAESSETVLATVAISNGSFGGFVRWNIPIAVAAGTRVSMRVRTNRSGAGSIPASLSYYAQPLTGTTVTTTSGTILTGTGTTGLSVASNAVAWANGLWVQVTAATTTPWTLNGLSVVSSFFIGIPQTTCEIDVGVGGSGSEVVVTTFRARTWFDDTGTTVYSVYPSVAVIGSGQRVAMRVRSSTGSITYLVKLMYYPSLLLNALTTTQAQAWVPSAADATSVTTPASAWTSGSWVQYVASTSTPIAVPQLLIETISEGAFYEVDLGVGPNGNEEVVGTSRFAISSPDDPNFSPQAFFLIAPTIPAGSRVSLRARSSSAAGTTLTISLASIANPAFEQMSADAVQSVYPPASSGSSVASSGVAYTYSNWVELSSATATANLLSGLSFTGLDPSGSVNSIVQIGAGPSGSEAAIATMPIGGWATEMFGWQALPFPLLVDVGTRLVARFTTSSTGAVNGQFALTYYGDIVPDTPPSLDPLDVEIRWLRRSPHVSSNGSRLFFGKLQVDMQVGVGSANTPDPVVMLRTSNDGGQTWSSIRTAPMGQIGKYLTRVQWYRNGSARDRVFEISGTGDVMTAIIQAWIEAEEGEN